MPVNPEEPAQPPAGLEEAPAVQPKPRCPHCGWQNVRIARTRNFLDAILAAVSVRRFKCRSCGRYFRHRYRSLE